MSDDTNNGPDEAPALPAPLKIEPDVLDPKYVTEIIEHINRKSVSPDDACPVCGSHLNTVEGFGLKVPVKESAGALDSGREMPLIVTICHNCGFARFFNRNILDGALAEHRQKAEMAQARDEIPEPGGINAG